MKKILGLDLGTNSIGWAVVNEEDESKKLSCAKNATCAGVVRKTSIPKVVLIK